MINPSAPPGKSTKYARPEFERRFLLADVPDAKPTRAVAITDRYLEGSRLRLRLARDGDDTVYKLTQKVPAAEDGPGLLTTMYLDRREYELLAALPGCELRKTRSSFPPLGIDVFEGEHAGLVLAEAEFETAAEMRAFTPPPFAVCEVTADPRFTGGHLAAAGRDELRAALAEFGLAG